MITRAAHKKNYTVIANAVLTDSRLTLKARGLMGFMLSRAEKWEFSIEGLKVATGEGKVAIRSALAELEQYEYICKKEQNRDENGNYSRGSFDVFEIPLTENEMAEKPPSEKQATPNCIQINKEFSNYQETSNDISNINPSILEDIERMSEVVKENIKFKTLEEELSPSGKAQLAEIINIIADTIVNPKEQYIICGQVILGKCVQSQFTKLKYIHIKTSLENIRKANKITNMEAYIISTLYRSLQTAELQSWNNETADEDG